MAEAHRQAISAIEQAPAEVLHDIFMHIALGYPRRDSCHTLHGPHPLLPIVQVNKRFNALASPLLVHDWRLRLTGDGAARFVLHLLKHTSLRSQVKSLALDPVSSESALPGTSDYSRWLESMCSVAEAEQLLQSARQACPTLANWQDEGGLTWADHIQRRSPGAIATLAVAWASELKELDLTMDLVSFDKGQDPWLIRLVKMAAGVLLLPGGHITPVSRSGVFMKLRSVSMRRSNTEETLGGRGVAAAFFRLQGLRIFRACAMCFSGLTLDEADPSGTALQPLADQLFPNGTSTVEEIYINMSFITDNGIRVLTRACKRLRTLSLEWGDETVCADLSEFSSGAIADAIKLHTNSLEKIHIDSAADFWLQNEGSDPGCLGDCLKACDKLERLAIDLVILYGREGYDESSIIQPLSQLLPSSLTSLMLTLEPPEAGDDVTKGNVASLLRECGPNGRFSKLKELDLSRLVDEGRENQDLVAAAQEAGVKMTLRAAQVVSND